MNEFLKDLEVVNREENFEDIILKWKDLMSKNINKLIGVSKLNNIHLDDTKKWIRNITDDLLDEYHYIEKYHLLPEEKE
jgi:hypothetical protein